MARSLLLLALSMMMVTEVQAQPTRGNGSPPTGGSAARGPDLGKINQGATRILDRPGCLCGPFGYVPFGPYVSPFAWYPPYFVEVPIFVPFDPFLPPGLGRVPLAGPPPAVAPIVKNNNNAINPPVLPLPAKAPPGRDELEQRAEMLRHIRSGNDALAGGEYHSVLRRYEQAVAAASLEPAGYFHLAQGQLALGRHAQAVVSIQRGLRMHPKWPESGFQPRALYRDRVNDYEQHLAQLAEAVAKNLNDDSLLFLLGYQLWFDGRRDEGIKLFERAGGLAFDRTFVDRFLLAPKVAANP